MYREVFSYSLTLIRIRGTLPPHPSFPTIASLNVGTSPQDFMTFSFDPFDILLKNFKAIASTSPELLNLNQDHPPKGNGFSGQIFKKLKL